MWVATPVALCIAAPPGKRGMPCAAGPPPVILKGTVCDDEFWALVRRLPLSTSVLAVMIDPAGTARSSNTSRQGLADGVRRGPGVQARKRSTGERIGELQEWVIETANSSWAGAESGRPGRKTSCF